MFRHKVLRCGMAVLACAALIVAAGGCSKNTAPTVVSTDPAAGATGVPVSKNITAVFSEEMDPATITGETFTLTRGTTLVEGTVTYTGVTATFNPGNTLVPNTLYRARITTGAEALGAKSTAQVDKSGVCPGVVLGVAVVATGAIVAASVSGCNPEPENALAEDYVWSFTTGTLPQGEGEGEPVEGEVLPEGEGEVLPEGEGEVLPEGEGEILPEGEGEILPEGEGEILPEGEGEVLPEGEGEVLPEGEGEILPEGEGEILPEGEGEILPEGEGEGVAQAPVDLGTASSFAILAGSTVSSTGNSIITGDLGVSPGEAVTGFPPGVLNGTMFTGVASAAGQAKLDLTVAFNDAAGRSTGPVSLPGDISGLTLYPGLYTNSTSVMLSAGTVTLDALGDANAVFIFQMGSTLTTGSGTQVILSGGAKAANIYWQVGSSATLGTNSIFKGNILAQESITLATGATLEGRALTQTAAVSLDAAVITVPAP